MGRQILILAFSALLLVPVVAQNAFAGQACNTDQTPLVDLIAGECIIAGDKQFDNWMLESTPIQYDLANVQVVPVNDDPNNPGLRFLTPGFTVGIFMFEFLTVSYDVTSLSEDLIKDFSLEITDATGSVSMEEFLDPCCENKAFASVPGFPFGELEFTPTPSIGVILAIILDGIVDDTELKEFVALYSQLPAEVEVVGGEFLAVDSTALLLAGLQTSAVWMIPVLVGAAGAGAFYFKTKRN